MRKFKRFLLILTAFTVMLTTCACSFDSEDSDEVETEATTTQVVIATQEATTETTTTAEETTSATTTTKPSIAMTTTTATEAEEPEEATDMNLVMGSVVDGVYINEYFDYSFAIPDTWYFVDDDELMEEMEIDPDDVASESARQEILSETRLLYISMSYDMESNAHVYTYAENMNLVSQGSQYTAEIAAKNEKNTLLNSGYSVGSVVATTIGSNAYYTFDATREHEDGYTIQVTMFFRKSGDYMLTIMVCTYDDEDADASEIISWMSDADNLVDPSVETLDMHDVMGSVRNGVYTNDYFDFSFVPAGPTWSFYSDDEILEENYIDPDDVSTEEEWQEALSEKQLLLTCVVYDLSTNQNLYMYAENMDILRNGSLYTLEQYALRDAADFDNYTFGDFDEVTIGSSEYLRMTGTRLHDDGYTVYKTFLYKQVDNYIFTVIITTFSVSSPSADAIITWMGDANWGAV
ncbi:MAG: hypothetical protein LUG49_05285 [Oscillospiraceae bacterium]|nr:hypothetical protein [Oscillospiraceae bacterium]